MKKSILLILFSSLVFTGCHSISTEIKIDAPADKVWQEVMDTSAYPTWNPFIKKVKGNYEQGKKVSVTIEATESKPMVFKPKVLELDDNSLRWKGRFLMPGIFTGEHYFRAEEQEDGSTVFYQGEEFSGILVPFFGFSNTEAGFQKMNTALKERSESLNSN